jgi:hypothetical protein
MSHITPRLTPLREYSPLRQHFSDATVSDHLPGDPYKLIKLTADTNIRNEVNAPLEPPNSLDDASKEQRMFATEINTVGLARDLGKGLFTRAPQIEQTPFQTIANNWPRLSDEAKAASAFALVGMPEKREIMWAHYLLEDEKELIRFVEILDKTHSSSERAIQLDSIAEYMKNQNMNRILAALANRTA